MPTCPQHINQFLQDLAPAQPFPPTPEHRHHQPSTPNRTATPVHRNPPITQPIRIHRLKHARTHVDVVFGAGLAGVDDGGRVRAAGGRVFNAYRGAAFRVGVGVGAVLHDAGGERHDGVGGRGCVAAGTEAWVGLVWDGRTEDQGQGVPVL